MKNSIAVIRTIYKQRYLQDERKFTYHGRCGPMNINFKSDILQVLPLLIIRNYPNHSACAFPHSNQFLLYA